MNSSSEVAAYFAPVEPGPADPTRGDAVLPADRGPRRRGDPALRLRQHHHAPQARTRRVRGLDRPRSPTAVTPCSTSSTRAPASTRSPRTRPTSSTTSPTTTRWPRWGPRAAEEGARSILSVRMANDQEALGALNLYSARPHAYDSDSVDLALVFASHAATAISNSPAGHRPADRAAEPAPDRRGPGHLDVAVRHGPGDRVRGAAPLLQPHEREAARRRACAWSSCGPCPRTTPTSSRSPRRTRSTPRPLARAGACAGGQRLSGPEGRRLGGVKPFLLLGPRDDDGAADNEYAAFLAFTGLDRVVAAPGPARARPLGDVDLSQWSGIFLGGGPFNSSDRADLKSPVQHRVEEDLRRLLDVVVAQDFPFLGRLLRHRHARHPPGRGGRPDLHRAGRRRHGLAHRRRARGPADRRAPAAVRGVHRSQGGDPEPARRTP